jgi:hypothetical protein
MKLQVDNDAKPFLLVVEPNNFWIWVPLSLAFEVCRLAK